MDKGTATKREQALFQMCKRCENWTICHGSGCEPKRVLQETLASYDRIVYLIDKELGGINDGD